MGKHNMGYLWDISATTNQIENHFDLLSCFLNSASILPAIAADEQKNPNSTVTKEMSNGHLIIAFYLFRHSLELALKALANELNRKDIRHHNIKEMWNDLPPSYRSVLSEKMEKALVVLEKYSVLKDEQLFRYHVDKGGLTLKSFSTIENEDFDALSSAAYEVRHAYLCCIHLNKSLPPENDGMCYALYLLEKATVQL